MLSGFLVPSGRPPSRCAWWWTLVSRMRLTRLLTPLLCFSCLVTGTGCGRRVAIDAVQPCVFAPCDGLNLYRTEVTYRLRLAQAALLYAPGDPFPGFTYDTDRLTARLARLFGSTHSVAGDDWWPAFRRQFDGYLMGFPEPDPTAGRREWLQSGLDAIVNLYVFEVLDADDEARILSYVAILDTASERSRIAAGLRDVSNRSAARLEDPRVQDLARMYRSSGHRDRQLGADRSRILGHRGGWGTFPENTLGAFESAWALGADGIECDARLTADGEVVIAHSNDLAYLVMKPFQVGQARLDSFLSLRLRDPFSLKAPGPEHPVTLETLLDEAPGDRTLWVELKADGGADLPRRVGDLLAARTQRERDRMVVSSLSPPLLSGLRGRFPNLRLAYEFSNLQPDSLTEILEGPDTHRLIVSVRHFESRYPAVLSHLKASGIRTSTFTPNRFDELARCLAGGIDFIQTDRPDRALLLESRMHDQSARVPEVLRRPDQAPHAQVSKYEH